MPTLVTAPSSPTPKLAERYGKSRFATLRHISNSPGFDEALWDAARVKERRLDPPGHLFVRTFVVAFAGATGIVGLFHLDLRLALPLTIVLAIAGALYEHAHVASPGKAARWTRQQLVLPMAFLLTGASCFALGYFLRLPLVKSGLNIPNLRFDASSEVWKETGGAIQGHRGANTFRNPDNASGLGPRVPAGAHVAVSCKIYRPTSASARPDGYWYRISSPPWKNRYFAVANTFMNGDPWDGPYTHNTDFTVPTCKQE